MRKILTNKYYCITAALLILIFGFMFSQHVSRQSVNALQSASTVSKNEAAFNNEPASGKGEEIRNAINYDTGCMTWDKSGQGRQNSQTERCFHLVSVLQREGAGSALKLFARLYEEDQNFEIGACHLYAHSIGVSAFREFGEGALSVDMFSSMPLMPARCAVKAYHGFLQEFLTDVPTDKSLLEKARAYCSEAGKNSSGIMHDMLRGEIPLHCMLGTGYGILYSYAKHGYQEKEAVNAALADCETFSDKESLNMPCISGVYEGVSMLYLGVASDELSWALPQDPFAVCKGEESFELKRVCFVLLRPVAWALTPDLQKVSKFLEGVEEGVYKIMMQVP